MVAVGKCKIWTIDDRQEGVLYCCCCYYYTTHCRCCWRIIGGTVDWPVAVLRVPIHSVAIEEVNKYGTEAK